jgi:putative glutamine amidotransferase
MAVIIGVPVQRRTPGDDCVLSLAPAYVSALERAGATALVLPLFEAADDAAAAEAAAPLLALCHGFLLTGSVADVHPHRYGGGSVPEGGYCDERRDALDWLLLDHAERTNKPVFGICRGCQAMNVYRGGTLAWHHSDLLPDRPVEHLRPDISQEATAHTVTWEKGTWLAAQMPVSVQGVNSLHRQVCARVAPSLRVAALSEDGLVEAVEDVRHPDRFFAVQWHPELLAADNGATSLFDRFLRACRAGMRGEQV